MGHGDTVVIGVDESGTGAFAGPFTISALAMYKRDVPIMRSMGVTDSKRLSDKARRLLVDSISDVALCAITESIAPSQTFDPGMKPSWRSGIVSSISKLLPVLQSFFQREHKVVVVVDGNPDSILKDRLTELVPCYTRITFKPKADMSVAAVGAASILAKTLRNDLMLDLHERYPEYGWNKSYGYGTPAHLEALRKHGTTDQHRNVKLVRALIDKENVK